MTVRSEDKASEDAASEDKGPELLGRVIERALKSFGLIAQAGGFGVVALDLADVPMPALRRLPFTTWFRLQRLIEGSQTVGILLAREPVGRSARGVTVRIGAEGRPGTETPRLRAGESTSTAARRVAAEASASTEAGRVGAVAGARSLGAEGGTRVIWMGTNDCARVLAGFALRPQVQSARRLDDQLRDAATA